MTHFQLHPHVTIHDRANGEIQLGTNPHTALIVRGISRELLRHFDGRHNVEQIATKTHYEVSDLQTLVATLQRAGHLIESDTHEELPLLSDHERRTLLRETHIHDVSKRLETVIYIHGLNRMGVIISSLLREAGFPHLRFVDARLVTASDVQMWGFGRVDIGERRDRTLALIHESLSRGALHKQIHPRVTVPRALHVLVADQRSDWPVFDPQIADEFMSSAIDHLVVAYGDTQSLISPVISTDTAGCLRCHFQSIVDQDSSWPLIFNNILNQDISDRAPIGLLIDTAIEVVARLADYFHDQVQDTLLSISWPAREHIHQSWIAHPGCGCQWDQMN